MSGERQVYRDARGNTFKATEEYAQLRGYTLVDQSAPAAESEVKARSQAANKARSSSANK